MIYLSWVQRHFPFSPKFQKFWLEIKWNRPFQFGLTRIFGPPLKVFHFDQSAHLGQSNQNLPAFTFDKIFVSITTPLYPAYKNNEQTGSGLGWVGVTRINYTVPLGIGISKISSRN